MRWGQTQRIYQIEKEVHMKKHRFGLGVLTGFLITSIIGASIAVGFFYGAYNNAEVSSRSEKKLNLIEKAIDNYYLGDVDKNKEVEGVYKGIVQGLGDKYSEYITAEEYAKEKEENSGEYCGIGAGIAIDEDKGYPMVTFVYPNSPSEKVGIQKGDYIIELDGKDNRGLSADQVASKARGKKGTKLKVKYFSKKLKKYQEVTITRDVVDVPSVDSTIIDKKYNIAYMQLGQFIENTHNQFAKQIKKLKKKNAKGIIIDLRGNPGGLLTSVTKILDDICPEGKLITVKDKEGRANSITSDARQLDIPLVLIVDGTTASAAELFSGAVQDYNKGKVVGEQTYGKGVVQNTYPLTDGSALKLTVEKYYTPKGRSINHKGITPDIKVSNTETEDVQYKTALNTMKKVIDPKKFEAEQKAAQKVSNKAAQKAKAANKNNSKKTNKKKNKKQKNKQKK